jgi:hypothetical protein
VVRVCKQAYITIPSARLQDTAVGVASIRTRGDCTVPYDGVTALFQAIVQNTQLRPDEVADAAGKHGRVRRALNKHYYGVDSSSANSLLVGSYGKDTETRPPSDVDILFEMPWAVYTRITQQSGNVQSRLLQEVKSVLVVAFPTTRMKADGQVILVPFSTYAVEVLPVFKLSTDRYWHADTNGGGSWRTTDPRSEKAALVSSNASTGGKTTHLIKLAKAWKATRGVGIKSFVLELAAVRFLQQWGYAGPTYGFAYYDFMLRDFFSWLQNQQNTYWAVPGVSDIVATGDGWAAQARIAANAAARATEHGAADRLTSAKSEWRNVLGDYVP